MTFPSEISVNFHCFISVSDRTHANFNSKEVGMELAQSMLSLFDPALDGMVLDTEKPSDLMLISIYSQPKTVSTLLPGKKNKLCLLFG